MLPPQVPLPAESANEAGLDVFEVFRQEKEGDPMRHAGSVVAPDADLALHYAREFFARRQESHRLWVVPRREIRELDDPDLLDPPLDRLYKKPGGYVMRDKLAARHDPQPVALHYAREFFARRQESHRLWVVPRRAIRELDDPDLLDPPLDRLYKKPGGYVMRDKLAAARGRSGVEKRTASTGRTTKGVDEAADEQAAEAQPSGERAPEAEA